MRGTSAEAGSRSAAEIRPFLFAFLPVFAGMVASLPQWSPGGKRAPEGPMVPGQEFGPCPEIGGQVFSPLPTRAMRPLDELDSSMSPVSRSAAFPQGRSARRAIPTLLMARTPCSALSAGAAKP